MSRPLRFRAWSPSMREWRGDWSIDEYKIVLDLNDTENKMAEDLVLSQSTGICDARGVEIFEGDIVMSPSWWWGPRFVYLDMGRCGACNGDSVGSFVLACNIDFPTVRATHNIWDGREVEVIGNIYEHPERVGKPV